MKSLVITAMAACLCSFASAGVWAEVGDAGPLPPGQITVGAGSLDLITGHLGGPIPDEEDMYCIHIPDPHHFRATTVGLTSIDTQLFLFNSAGMGVTFNDDSASTFQSTLTSAFLTSGGMYFLAISAYDHDAMSPGGEIWLDGPFGAERAPDGPGAGGPIVGWAGTSFSDGEYGIRLEGAEFCEPVPEPATMAALGLGALGLIRRRRNKA